MKKIYGIIVALLMIGGSISAQNTVGLLSYNASQTYDGYNLLYPHNQPNVYLLDNCGELVHMWKGEPDTRPGNTAYIRSDGRLVKTSRPAEIINDPIWAGGGGSTIEIRDWDNNLEWSFTMDDTLMRMHHDIAIVEKEEGFNILGVAWEVKTLDEVIAAGRDTSVLASGEMWPDFIFEIDPESDEIVWEWHVWDHLVQDFDSTKNNFGVIAEHPELVNVNYDFIGNGNADWMHSNSIDYDPVNDQVLLCIPNFHEIWIIDHTTTTAEAAGHIGGFGNRGGDLMFRWGNPQLYDAGTAEDQKLFFPHNAKFVDDFIDVADPNLGSISLFNNRVGSDFSTVNILRPQFDMYDWSFQTQNGTWLPNEFSLDKKHPVDSTLMWSTGLSSVQYLPNGSLLICVGRFGYMYEMTPDDRIVWEYKTPIRMGQIIAQGDSVTINQNITFKFDRYPADYSAFDGKDLSSKGWLELNPDSNFCELLLPTEDLFRDYGLKMYPNPTSDMLTLEWDAGIYISIEVFDAIGRPMVQSMRCTGGRKYINTSDFPPGVYFLRVDGKHSGSFIVR